MRLFKRKLKNSQSNERSDKLATKIAGLILNAQRKFAASMGKMFSDFSTMSKKAFVLVLFFVCGGLSVYYIVDGVVNFTNKQQLKVDQTKIPAHYDQNNDVYLRTTPIDEQTWQQIKTVRQYIDSLKIDSGQQFDSLIKNRPGLIDSIATLEEMYYSQNK
jgi:hypothetical protein